MSLHYLLSLQFLFLTINSTFYPAFIRYKDIPSNAQIVNGTTGNQIVVTASCAYCQTSSIEISLYLGSTLVQRGYEKLEHQMNVNQSYLIKQIYANQNLSQNIITVCTMIVMEGYYSTNCLLTWNTEYIEADGVYQFFPTSNKCKYRVIYQGKLAQLFYIDGSTWAQYPLSNQPDSDTNYLLYINQGQHKHYLGIKLINSLDSFTLNSIKLTFEYDDQFGCQNIANESGNTLQDKTNSIDVEYNEDPQKQTGSSSLSLEIVGIAVGSLVGVIILVTIIFCIVKSRRKRKQNQQKKTKQENVLKNQVENRNNDSILILHQQQLKKQFKQTQVPTLSSTRLKINICPICLCPNQDQSVQLQCSHLFHQQCINFWMKTNQNCPSCLPTRSKPSRKNVKYQVLSVIKQDNEEHIENNNGDSKIAGSCKSNIQFLINQQKQKTQNKEIPQQENAQQPKLVSFSSNSSEEEEHENKSQNDKSSVNENSNEKTNQKEEEPKAGRKRRIPIIFDSDDE